MAGFLLSSPLPTRSVVSMDVYSKNVIEYVTVVAEVCLLLERTDGCTRTEWTDRMLRLLPLLYAETVALDNPATASNDALPRLVTEDDYQYVRDGVARLLGSDDAYLEVFHPDMKYSDTPIAAFISENMADIYQELKDFAANYRTGVEAIMSDSLLLLSEAFSEHWGQKLLNALRALHSLRHSDDFCGEV